MQVVWDRGPCAVEAVYEVVSQKRDLKETSVRTILRRLEQDLFHFIVEPIQHWQFLSRGSNQVPVFSTYTAHVCIFPAYAARASIEQ